MAESKEPGQTNFGLPQKREEVTLLLSNSFARDFMDIEEYEKRIALVHQASSLKQLEEVISDIPAHIKQELALVKKTPPANVTDLSPDSASSPITAEPIVLQGSVRRFSSTQLEARSISIAAKGSTIRMDYRDTRVMPSRIHINLQMKGSTCRIIVPPNVSVQDEISLKGSAVRNRRSRKYRNDPTDTVIVISGFIQGSTVRIKTRKRRN